ncbi:hypothetical protein [Falsiroseomonas selenitidurans]|uniref:Uncharacterized protein n=1 Tax=Falsiroseomonas selenitidurans TaxID=2716335 RepID=A0ABX1EAY8_9PROT|nr:hypothetical protein [Falsiroseomonas selenitidurans]NKC34351.1 hypothetical protein [Falsiroseomonas selenitidurans]OYW29167.1 MAG: hypothetical protein B7Z44_05730 [Caulobacter sp. 12-67-6]
MRVEPKDHRPVTEQAAQPSQAAWMGAAEAERQQALLRVAGRPAEPAKTPMRRRTDRPASGPAAP